MIKIDKIIGYDIEKIERKISDYNIELDREIVELQLKRKQYNKKYNFLLAIMVVLFLIAIALCFVNTPYIVIAQVVLIVGALFAVFKIPSVASKQLKLITQESVLRRIKMADVIFHQYVNGNDIEYCTVTSHDEKYCSVKIAISNIDYNISEQEILFLYQETDVDEPVLDISKQTVFIEKQKENHNDKNS